MSEIIPPSTLAKLTATAQLLREIPDSPVEQFATSVVTPSHSDLVVDVEIVSASGSILSDTCVGKVYKFKATGGRKNPDSVCVVNIGFTEHGETKINYTITEFPVDSSVVIETIEEAIKFLVGFFG